MQKKWNHLNQVQIAYVKIHIAVLLFGLTAILGGLIQMSAISLVWWRLIITVISLVFLIKRKRMLSTIGPKLFKILVLNGVIIAIHWICFYGSIKLSNASVALVCLASASFFAAIAEPLITSQRFSKLELSLGLLIIPGMIFTVSELDFSMIHGVWVGIIAALCSAVFAAINKKIVAQAHTTDITFVELLSGLLFLTLLLPFISLNETLDLWPAPLDWVYLMVLSLLCTTVAFVLSLQSLTQLSAFNSTLIVNLEPIYGILLAWIILNEHEQLTPTFYVGVAIILAIVFAFPILRWKYGR